MKKLFPIIPSRAYRTNQARNRGETEFTGQKGRKVPMDKNAGATIGGVKMKRKV
jgi:hypothetical protein